MHNSLHLFTIVTLSCERLYHSHHIIPNNVLELRTHTHTPHIYTYKYMVITNTNLNLQVANNILLYDRIFLFRSNELFVQGHS